MSNYQSILFPEYEREIQLKAFPDPGVITGDCLDTLRTFPEQSFDLVFADPPFNIGYQYDVYDDKKTAEDYLAWSKDWMSEVYRVLKDSGSFWLAIGDEFAAELKVIANREIGFSVRSWVIWYYTFGVNCKNKFTRSHTHLLYFVKNPEDFCFNADDTNLRIPSARQLVYNDRRANPKGRLPDDTWILRPQDLDKGFLPTEDTWYFPRVAGTFKQRQGWHGCQMPEQILARIVRSCSKEGDKVLDPFAGSGTTLRAAKKLDRKAYGIEISKDYTKQVNKELNKIQPGDDLQGSSDPLASAPATGEAKKKSRVKKTVAKTTSSKATSTKKPSVKKSTFKKSIKKPTSSTATKIKKTTPKKPAKVTKKSKKVTKKTAANKKVTKKSARTSSPRKTSQAKKTPAKKKVAKKRAAKKVISPKTTKKKTKKRSNTKR